MPDNDFGYTAWGKAWVRLAEPLSQTRPDPHLPRARRLARDGHVQVAVEGTTVRAAIQHGRNRLTADIEVAPMPKEELAEISRRLSGGQPALTDELYRAIVAAGHPPAPKLARVECSCPTSAPRCVHVLAVYYEMARRIDDDPRIALSVRGFFRAPQGTTDVSTPVAPQRWIALSALDPADYFSRSA
ncbi:SWIM zinc finger family protein [Yinghuangia seranimata]|uniref:SWIM zinc finger family protein n=1 Tax=Yinghuangia seranimata TaxID=408067 RepID=UPI00248D1992|nr:SWIM zinc finger family protein [Yinghuangia seranimata]MDI2129038.1 SWIM zinc finger family protein [Yinghuangia seranimata]